MRNGQPRTDRRSCRRRFTLLELLIVSSIIGILVAMLLPALNRAKAKGKQAKCNNRLKQLGIAFTYYVTDHEGFMVFDAENPATPEQYWHQKIREELGETGDASTPVQFVSDPGVSAAFSYSGNDEANYLYNAQVNGLRLVQAENTEATLLLFDGSDKLRIGGTNDAEVGNLLGNVVLTFPHPADKSNVLSLDGHTYVVQADITPASADDRFWKPSN